MLFVLFTLEDFIGVRKLSRARESSPPRSARGRHSAGAVGHSVCGKVAGGTSLWKYYNPDTRPMAVLACRRRYADARFLPKLAATGPCSRSHSPPSPTCSSCNSDCGRRPGEAGALVNLNERSLRGWLQVLHDADQLEVVREVLARRIIAAARFGKRDLVRLRAAALAGVGRPPPQVIGRFQHRISSPD